MWAQKSSKIPKNYNDTQSRFKEIMYSDKTEFEEVIVNSINDHVALSKDLIKLAREKGATHDEIEKLMMTPIKSRFYHGIERSNIDLIRGKFPMKILRISRRDDPDDIAHQSFDFTPKTLEILEKEGYEDSRKSLDQLGI